MKSHRKKRGRASETKRIAKPQLTEDADGKSAPPSSAAHPPKRNIAMLAVSLGAFSIWIMFLVYVALFA